MFVLFFFDVSKKKKSLNCSFNYFKNYKFGYFDFGFSMNFLQNKKKQKNCPKKIKINKLKNKQIKKNKNFTTITKMFWEIRVVLYAPII